MYGTSFSLLKYSWLERDFEKNTTNLSHGAEGAVNSYKKHLYKKCTSTRHTLFLARLQFFRLFWEKKNTFFLFLIILIIILTNKLS